MNESAEKSEASCTFETASKLLRDWRNILSRGVEEAEAFTKDKPVAGLTLAFLAGVVISSLFRRR